MLLAGYRVIHRTRQNKNGVGVAIYVNDSISFKIIDTMSVVTDDIFESVTVELCLNKKYNIIVSCIYMYIYIYIYTYIYI